METSGPSDDERIGRYVRQLRRARGLTLIQLADLSELSQPFLSQLERGRARPSLASLSRIAHALGSSQLELISGAAQLTRPRAGRAPTLVRSGRGDRGPYGLGEAELLVTADRPFHPMTFTADNAAPGAVHTHPEDEFVHVLAGGCVVDLGPDGVFTLATGDSLYYVGGTPHRWYSPDGSGYRLFVVKQHVLVPAAVSHPTRRRHLASELKDVR
ncbi:MAG: helix-turn-helix domain-containing protein [Propionibacteriaceae bacterium]